MSPGNRSPDDIRREMAALRHDLGEEMNELADDAREMSDWRYYVRRYPWVCLGAAAAVGYLLVPQKLEVIRPDPKDLMRLAEKNGVMIKPQAASKPRGPGRALMSFLVSAAMRSALAYGGQKLGAMMHSEQG